MTPEKYPLEVLDPDEEDDGTIVENVATLADAVVGHRIVDAEWREVPKRWSTHTEKVCVITLDNGKEVLLRDTSDCCAYTQLNQFLLNVDSVDHIITGIGTTGKYTTWHIYADLGDILKLELEWGAGNPFYYGYGFDIEVVDL